MSDFTLKSPIVPATVNTGKITGMQLETKFDGTNLIPVQLIVSVTLGTLIQNVHLSDLSKLVTLTVDQTQLFSSLSNSIDDKGNVI